MRTTLWLAVAACLVVPLPLRAATEAHFTLGLTGEALSTRQEVAGDVSRQDSLGGTVALGVDGGIFDRRFLSFGGLVQYSTFDLTDSGAGQSDLKYDQWTYAGSLRAFSNRMITVGGGILHTVSTPTGDSRGGIVGGVQDNKGVDVAFRSAGLPEVSYAYDDARFTADDPQALRDESRRRHTVKVLAAYGLVRAALEVRKEDLEYFSGVVRQDLRVGAFNLDVNRGGKNSWETVLNGNQVRIAVDGGVFSDPTTVYFARNTFRHKFTESTYFDLGYSRQVSEDPERSLDADLGSAVFYYQASKAVLLDARLSYLAQDDEFGSSGRIQQPSGSVGAQWGRQTFGWNLLAYPHVSYTATSAPGRETESGLGGQLYMSAQRAYPSGSSFLLDVDGLYNQLSIAPLATGAHPTDTSFLSGLEKNHLRGRVTWTLALGRASRLSILADAARRVRFFEGRDVTESQYAGNVSVQWRAFSVVAAVNRLQQVAGDIPTDVTIFTGTLSWTPIRWLQMDAAVTSEDRTVLESRGKYEYAEGGVRFLYARLSFFARVRETLSSGNSSPERSDRRIWAGLSRTFDFPTLLMGRSKNGNGNGSGNWNGNGRKGQ